MRRKGLRTRQVSQKTNAWLPRVRVRWWWIESGSAVSGAGFESLMATGRTTPSRPDRYAGGREASAQSRGSVGRHGRGIGLGCPAAARQARVRVLLRRRRAARQARDARLGLARRRHGAPRAERRRVRGRLLAAAAVHPGAAGRRRAARRAGGARRVLAARARGRPL